MSQDNLIDYGLIAKALDFYKNKGYKDINVPWHVRQEVSNITCPAPALAYPFEDGVLVGSSEQSMIQMVLDGELEDGYYVTCSPCFRNEPVIDAYHQKYFMKVELFHTGLGYENYEAFHEIRKDASEFFKSLTNRAVTWVGDECNTDFEIDGVEIGSYNMRASNGISWVCGTGLALPRFSKVR